MKLDDLPEIEPTNRWHLFAVFAGAEEKLAAKIGDTAYYPRRVVYKKRRGRLKLGEVRHVRKFVPMIPGYLFYNGRLDDPAVNWIYNDRKVIGLMTVDGAPIPVRNVEIHRMRLAELAGSDEVMEVFSVIVGDTLDIIFGPFAGNIGVVREIQFGKVTVDFPLVRSSAKFSVLQLGKISDKR
jgi:transcription antitermination factor NusG